MVSNSFFDIWKDASVKVLTRSHSDHCPIQLKVAEANFGPKPFKVFNKWFNENGFNDLVTSSWASFPPNVSPDICLKNKLKCLRLAIKDWTSKHLAAQNATRDTLKSNLLEWDKKAENGLISLNDTLKREEWMMDLIRSTATCRDDLKQKSHVRWAVEGDENTRFFHSTITCNKGVFKGISLTESKVNVSLLQYADDALFFGEWSRSNAKNLIHILKCFEMGSGLKVNISKSRIIGVGVPATEVESMAASLGCAHDSLPFIYLGLPVGKRMRYCDGWNVVIERFRDKLSCWKAKALSIGGRLTLIKSILGSLPIYYFSLFKAPQKVINTLESIRCRFFWGFKESHRGLYWVKWKTIILDSKFGGLGVGCLASKNMGLLGKWKWRFLTEDKALWNIVIKDFYGADGGFNLDTNQIGTGGIWPDIISVTKSIGHIDADFERSFVRKVNNGSDTLFWKDQWCCNGVRLMEAFPRLFALETHKDCTISDRWGLNNNEGGWKWAWRFPPRGRANNDLESLISFVGSLNLSVEDRDVWKWALDGSGTFKVCTLSKRIQNLLLANFSVGNHHLWNSLIPRKVNICVWRASLNRLPTRANLSSRGVMLESSTCPFCENVIEDLDHSAINCPVVLPIWRKVWCWWNLASPVAFPSFSISDISTGNIGPDGNAKMGKIIHGVFQISLWAIWKWRNRIVNASADSSPKIKEEDIFPAIQRLSRTWIAARLVSNSANWDVWISRPYDLFS
ncbi:putative RNA-directed DNA polymerase, eukaryota, reverse transcriptase zinc-binding domain protein [Tanacetum coccineum]